MGLKDLAFLKNYGLPILEAAATVAIAVLTVLLGIWLTEALADQDGNTTELALSAIWNSRADFSTPIPWLGLSLLCSLIGRVEGL